MRGTKTALLVGILAMFAAPFAANADILFFTSPLEVSADASGTVTLELYINTDVGTETDNFTFSVASFDSTLDTFLFQEAFAPNSGIVTWGPGKNVPPFAGGGTQTNLNTSGSLPSLGDGLGTVLEGTLPVRDENGDIIADLDTYAGSIGMITPTLPLTGDGTNYLIGTFTVTVGDVDAVVRPFFRQGEGAFNLAPAVPTVFRGTTITVPEASAGLLAVASVASLAVLRRRRRT